MIDLEYYKNKLLEKYKEKNDDEMYERYEHSLNVCEFISNLIDHHKIKIDKILKSVALVKVTFSPFKVHTLSLLSVVR